jgi:hypothetical protein
MFIPVVYVEKFHYSTMFGYTSLLVLIQFYYLCVINLIQFKRFTIFTFSFDSQN